MRNISVAYTREVIRSQTKTVTRRTGWLFLKAGDILQPVEKCMGFKKGEKIKKVGCPILVISAIREPISFLLVEPYGTQEAKKEGFPEMSGRDFYNFFVKEFKIKTDTVLTRIEFRYVTPK